ECPGVPLVAVGDCFYAFPVTAGEHARIAPSPGTVVLYRDGRIVVATRDRPVDPSKWFDLSGFQVCALEPLRSAAAAPQVRAEPVMKSVGEITQAPKLSAEAKSVLERLSRPQPPSFLERMAAWFRPRSSSGVESETAAPRKQGALGRFFAAAQWQLFARLGGFFRNQQQRFFTQTAKLFERGDLDAALRRAIPLSKRISEGLSRPSWGLPDLRRSLEITGPAAAGSGGSYFSSSWYDYLRETYRRAFETLDRRGEIDKAAFVLAELLDDANEAVLYLERHRRFRQAAEVADTKRLDPALRVRLWFQARDLDRAITIAVRHGVFHQTAKELDHRDSDAAAGFRALWSRNAAAAGRFSEAVHALWPVREHHPRQMESVLECAATIGGTEGAQMMGRWLRWQMHQGAEPSESLDRLVEELLASDIHGSPGHRATFARELATLDRERARYADPTLRALLSDEAAFQVNRERQLVSRLEKLCDDPALGADVPPALRSSPRPPLALVEEPIWIPFEPSRAYRPVFDAALLPNGRTLVAHGEEGVTLYDRSGVALTRFAAPCEEIVLSTNGVTALLIAYRDDVRTVHRLDLVTRKCVHWADARFHLFPLTFDGRHWLVTHGSALYLMEVTDEGWQASWAVTDLPGHPRSLDFIGDEAVMLIDHGKGSHEVWRYVVPEMRLRSRTPFERTEGLAQLRPFASDIAVQWEDSERLEFIRGGDAGLELGEPVVSLRTNGEWLAAALGSGVLLLRQKDLWPVIHVEGPDLRARFSGEANRVLTVIDPRGQLLHVETDTGAVVSRLSTT
ncbi:MAG: bpX6 domain-containing protein, partial [Myxococcota bacterium]